MYFVDGLGYVRYPTLSNSVFKIDPSGAITRVAGNSRTGFSGDGGPGASASLYWPVAVAADRAGNLFIVDAGNSRVRRVAPDGTITTVAGGGSAVLGDGGPALSGQLNYPSSIAVDNAGDLFIGEFGRVRKVTPDGIISTVAGGGPNDPANGGPATSVSLTNAAGVAVDGAGNLFIEDVFDDGDTYSNVIRKVSPDGVISTLPLVPGCCFESLAADSAGNLFVPTGSAVWRISPGGNPTIVAGTASFSGSGSGDGVPATQASLVSPDAVAVGPAGDLLIADNGGRNIRRVTSDGIIRTFASIPVSVLRSSGDGVPAVNAQLQLAVQGLSIQSGLAADSAGNLYIAETGAHRVRKVSPDGIITTVAGVGGPRCSSPSTCLPLGDNGPALNASLSYPPSVAVDGAGNLFIADSANFRVRKVSPSGVITTVAGSGSAYLSGRGAGDGGPATDATLYPTGVAVDGAGNLYILEGGDVRKVSPGGIISTVVAPAASAPYFVSAATADRAGNLFVAGPVCGSDDNCYPAIRKISPSGDSTTLVDGRNAYPLQPGAGIGDGGPAINAAIVYVSNLTVDAAGNLFIADLFAQRVRKIDLNGIITTVGGDGYPGYSGDGGPATNATMNFPFGLAADAAGRVYISDFNQSVRVLRP